MVWNKKDKEVKEVIEEAPIHKVVREEEAIVSELPQVATRKIRGEDGKVYNLVTSNEALQEVLEGVRELLNRTKD